MRALRFVSPGADGNHVIVGTSDGAEHFVLSVDVALRSAMRPEQSGRRPSAVPAAAIGPREIQVRVRAGMSAQELADNHDMTLEAVLRFAGPVLAERIRIADEARRARARRSTTEGQTVVFGEAVDDRFTAHGIDPGSVSWDAHRRDDGQWLVTAGWVGGDAERVAEWAFNLAARNVTPLDDTAAELLSDRPIRQATAVADPRRPSLVAAPALAPGIIAFPPMADPQTGPLPSTAELDEVFDQDAPDLDRRHGAAQRRADPGPGYDAPPLPLRLAEASERASDADEPFAAAVPAEGATARLPKLSNPGDAARDGAAEQRRPTRPRVPAWDDILLGVRRKSD
jgi:hypothetical protein